MAKKKRSVAKTVVDVLTTPGDVGGRIYTAYKFRKQEKFINRLRSLLQKYGIQEKGHLTQAAIRAYQERGISPEKAVEVFYDYKPSRTEQKTEEEKPKKENKFKEAVEEKKKMLEEAEKEMERTSRPKSKRKKKQGLTY